MKKFLASSDTHNTTLTCNLTKNEKDFYIAEGLWGVDNKKEQKEFIQVKLIPKK